MIPYLVDRSHTGGINLAPGFLNQVGDDRSDHAANDLVDQSPVFELWITRMNLLVLGFEERLRTKLIERQQARSETVIHVMIVISDRIRNIYYLRFKAGLLTLEKTPADVAELLRIAR